MSRPLTPELVEFWLQDLLLGTLKNEHRTTKKILEAVPADKADYRPDPVSKTATGSRCLVFRKLRAQFRQARAT